MSADDKQLRHDVLGALAERLDTISEGSDDWHERHQAGVLVSKLADSAHRQFGQRGKDTVHRLVNHAEQFYQSALQLPERSNVLAIAAINCDLALLTAFKHRVFEGGPRDLELTMLQGVVTQLLNLPPSSARDHQLAIAQGFMARTYWWMWLSQWQMGSDASAKYHEIMATRMFKNNLDTSPDGGRAYCSHLLAMALIHDALRARKLRWKCASQAFVLAWRLGDRAQQGRAALVWLHGNKGELVLCIHRTGPEAIRAALKELDALDR